MMSYKKRPHRAGTQTDRDEIYRMVCCESWVHPGVLQGGTPVIESMEGVASTCEFGRVRTGEHFVCF